MHFCHYKRKVQGVSSAIYQTREPDTKYLDENYYVPRTSELRLIVGVGGFQVKKNEKVAPVSRFLLCQSGSNMSVVRALQIRVFLYTVLGSEGMYYMCMPRAALYRVSPA